MSQISDGTIECGEDAARCFSFDAGYKNLNHGSFGTYPRAIRPTLRHYQDLAEARPDAFIRYEYPRRLDESRAAVARYLHARVETCVIVPNATMAFNTVLRNLIYQPGDVIIFFSTIYGACEKTLSYIRESTPAQLWKIQYIYPVSDEYLCNALEDAVNNILSAGRTPKIAIFDTIVSLPGVRMPFERLTELCKKHGILSCIDGAHGIGHISLDLPHLDPDFFFSNCHKWLHVPRGCAVLYVPVRNQHLMRSTLPTSHGFVPLPVEGEDRINNPLPPSGKSEFVTNFEFVGTLDNSPYLCIPAALEWRQRLVWAGMKGEEAIMAYCQDLACEGGKMISRILGTDIMENDEGTLGRCNFAMVQLPLSYQDLTGSDPMKAMKIAQWIAKVMIEDYKTFIAISFYADAWWVRLSAQVYLTAEDFKWGGMVLKDICRRVQESEWEEAEKRTSKL